MEKDSNFEHIGANPKIKSEIEVILTTTLSEEYQIANNRLPIPANYDSEKLRKLVKKLLKIKETKNFVFFINDILLDSTISEFLSVNNFNIQKISETGLEIVYSFEMEEPKLINTIKEDEWIKKISLRLNQTFDPSCQEYYSVGLFNSEVTIYNKNFEKILTVEQENKSENYCELLHDLLFMNLNDNLKENLLIKSSRNEDSTFLIYSVNLSEMNYNLLYQGKKNDCEYVNALSSNPVDFSFFSAGDTDGSIKIFKIPEAGSVDPKINEKNASNKRKKRKIDAQILEPESTITNCHGGNEIKILKWINNQQLLSSGDDFFIKLWNIHTQTNYSIFNTNYKLTTAICPILPGNEKFLSGHEDGTIRLWDIRVNNNCKTTFPNAHSNVVAEIVINPNTNLYSNNFSSVGYDGLLKIWDMRSTKKALYEIKTDSEKNYTVAYNSSNYLMTGGDSSSINIYETK